ncbi:MAG TPA: BlaI/MecI/CopY family transcriptional regulator [Lachnospiraceae bacterium]|nr:BlaI/MecI/CopY family transcriptional regulator [Lachnospiraceae bacterium]
MKLREKQKAGKGWFEGMGRKTDRDIMNNTASLVKLPEAEFEIMSVIWKNTPPITTAIIMNQMGNEKGWKLQTLITLLNRLIERGFLRSEKLGKERTYYPCITHDEYIQFETALFVERYHENSIFQLVNTFSGNAKLSKEEINELSEWLKMQEEE